MEVRAGINAMELSMAEVFHLEVVVVVAGATG
jgi:hypothetical protein